MIAILYRLVASLAALALTVVILAFVIDSTLLSANYIDSHAVKAGTYKALADSLNQQIEQKASGSGIFLAEESVKEPVRQFLIDLEKFYRAQGPVPALELASIGIPASVLPPDFNDHLPIIQQPTAGNIQFFYAKVAWLKTFGLAIVLVVFVLAVWLGHLAGHSHALTRFALKVTLFWGLAYLTLAVSPGLLTGSLSQSPDIVIKSFAAMLKATLQGISLLSLKVWLVLAGATVLIFIATKIMQLFARLGGHGGGGPKRPIEKFHPSKN